MKNKLSDEIFEQLKNDIVFNRLHAGEKIGEIELCRRYNVSRTPARQALQRLENLGLVEIRDGVGTFVTMIAEKDVGYAYEIRCMAEKLAVGKAINRIKEAELAEQKQRFLNIQTQLEKGGYGSSFEDMIVADWKLHDLIMENSGNPLLGQTVEKVTLLLRRCQCVYISQYERATRDHLEIIDCLMSKELGALYAVLDRHLKFRPNE